MMGALSGSLPRPRLLLIITALFVWFASGVEAWRLGDWHDVKQDPALLARRPWKALRAFVSRDGDDRLYFQYAELMLGRPGDLAYIASKRLKDPDEALAELAPLVRAPGPPRLPYRDFPFEYPPVPLVIMLLPRLIASTLAGYRIALAASLGVIFVTTAALGARLAVAIGTERSVDPVWRRMAWLAALFGPLLCARFDLLPAALVAGALLAVVRERDKLGGALFGVAVLTKLFPLLLLLPVAALLWGAAERRRAIVVLASATGAALLVSAPFVLVAPGPFLRAIALYGARPLHFESLAGSLVLAFGGGQVSGSFGSFNVSAGPLLLRVMDLLPIVILVGFGTAAWRLGIGLRNREAGARHAAVVRLAFAVLTTILCAGKVLSPQFLIWLLPVAALVGERQRGRAIFPLTLLAYALTHAYFPYLYGAAMDAVPWALAILLARNLVLVLLCAAAISAALGRRDQPSGA